MERLAAQFLRFGSVNALAQAMTEAEATGESKVYPNRIHGLLSADETRSVNTATLEAIERGLGYVESLDTEEPVHTREEIVARLAGFPLSRGDVSEKVAEELGVPEGVVRYIAGASATNRLPRSFESLERAPDWSWQDEAVAACLRSLRSGPSNKSGLIVPTGGGKTRIALRVILEWLEEQERDNTVVLWVTHRRRLYEQAHRELQKLLRAHSEVPPNASSLFVRIKFVMINELVSHLEDYGDRVSLVVIDEAHHAAAPSYRPVLEEPVRGLFLTATPNRTDELPIGIDEISYTIPYRELFTRGCVIEPTFAPPLDLPGLDWSRPDGLTDLADYLLERTESDFGKVLVAVSRRSRAVILHQSICNLLETRGGHPLSMEDIGYVHGTASSGGRPDAFLDEFVARPKGILVATSQLIGEGFDDPSIDAVVVTYPSSSIGHLMQVAGRALRWAPGKERAHVVQIRESPLEYHFEQRWLYQDISDLLRPDIIDETYADGVGLISSILRMMEEHNVPSQVLTRIRAELEDVNVGDDIHLMFTGMPFYGSPESFGSESKWGAILSTPMERGRFLTIFNDVSCRTEDIREQAAYLNRHIEPDDRRGSLRRSYGDLITAMEYARRELRKHPYDSSENRNHSPNLNTTWLRYVTFKYQPELPQELEIFLRDAVNRDAVVRQYLESRDLWASALRLRLPLGSSVAYLLTDAQSEWLESGREVLIARLRAVKGEPAFDEVVAWAAAQTDSPVPIRILNEMKQLLPAECFHEQRSDLAKFRPGGTG